jgi:hypothetical protein
MQPTVGFYYNCYKNRYATENILKQLRTIYPDEPIYLLSDHGDDFSDLAKTFNCYYKYSPIQILGGRVINGVRHMCFTNELCAKAYINEITAAINYCKTDYIVLMEDDVFIHGKIQQFPLHAGGELNSNKFQMQVHDFEPILNCKTIIECFEKTPFEEIRRFDYLCKTPFELWHTNDILLNYMLMINGKTADIWTNTNLSMIAHPDKRFYKKVDNNLGIYRL